MHRIFYIIFVRSFQEIECLKRSLPVIYNSISTHLFEAPLVFFIQLDAVTQLLEHDRRLLAPDRLTPSIRDVRLARRDHLVRDLDKQ